ncbi:hypothetical protein [Sorangium sp. So ce1000]|uniref:hypothetical protein n=1 Tax=Sorangium sp. So ce1000 TaxID=3133325 RepID=UPI003F63E85A
MRFRAENAEMGPSPVRETAALEAPKRRLGADVAAKRAAVDGVGKAIGLCHDARIPDNLDAVPRLDCAMAKLFNAPTAKSMNSCFGSAR